MRFLLINQFYPPDLAPTGVFLHDVARGLVAAGNEVSVVCSRGAYDGKGLFASRETRDGVAIRRVGGIPFGRSGTSTIASYLSFVTLALPRLQVGRRPDVVLTLTSPPYVGLLGAKLAENRRVRHVHWAMDIHPDVLQTHGMWSGFLRRKLEDLSRWQMARTRLVIAPAPGMAKILASRVGPGTSVESVPLWSRESAAAPDVAALRDALGWPRARLILLYSGNMSLGHRFPEFLEAARTLGHEGPLWLFAGSGPRREEVAAAAADPGAPIQLLPNAGPEEHLKRSLAADVHLISLRSSWDGLMMPSELQAAFGLGRPVIFVGSRTGEPGCWIEESGGGWVVIEGDMPGLIRAIAEAIDRGERTRRGAAALAYARQNFDLERNVARMVALLEGA